MREFDGGATRDDAEDKPSYGGYESPLVIESYGRYMLKHQRQADGTMRGADNWKAGMPTDVYFESLLRHVQDVHMEMDGYPSRDGLEEALNGVIFNAKGLLYEHLREQWGEPCVDIHEALEHYSSEFYVDDTEEPISHHSCDGGMDIPNGGVPTYWGVSRV